MKKFFIQIVILVGCIPFACAAVPAAAAPAASPLPAMTSLRAIAALTNTEASKHQPVAFQATVIYFYGAGEDLVVQDGDKAIFVRNSKDVSLAPGNRVQVRGTVQPSFLPYIDASEITVVGHGELPKPVTASFDDLSHSQLNCRLVSVRGVIRAGDLVTSPRAPRGLLQLLMDGGYVDIEIQSDDQAALKKLVDAEVEVTGAAGRKFDSKMQQAGIKIKVSSLADIKVLKQSSISPWSVPLTPLGSIFTGYHIRDLSKRLRVHGTVTYYQPGAAVVLQNGGSSLWVSLLTAEPLSVGDVVDATGFPALRDGHLALTHAEVQDSGTQAPITPQLSTWNQLASWGKNRPGGHEYDLVSVDGRVVSEVREAAQDEYVLAFDGQLFTAIYKHPLQPAPLPPMREVQLGSLVRVTGICLITDSNPVEEQVPFNILLRNFQDINVMAPPSLLTVHNLGLLVIWLLVAILAVGARAWFVDRTMRAKLAALGYIGQRRGRILEDINNARPLAGILESITEMASVSLKGAPCWCWIADGAKLGNCPPDLEAPGLRIVEHPIASHSGSMLGSIFAAFDMRAIPQPDEEKALSASAELATLAIETSNLHSDLVYRSEFDMLTDIQNRFSFERRLDSLIDEARRSGAIFGLIYIDLDNFKQVNDVFGHHVGDLYLRQVAGRMKHQLRPNDLLARLGGDEFGVLVPLARSRADVEEIALRLERCFDDPIVEEEYVLHGSASIGIALYPTDASNNDALLSAADAAMYEAKHSRKAAAKMPASPAGISTHL